MLEKTYSHQTISNKSIANNTETIIFTYTCPSAGYYFVRGSFEQTNVASGYKLCWINSTNHSWLCAASLGQTITDRHDFSNIRKLDAGEVLYLRFKHTIGSTATGHFQLTCARLA